jgi:hypothetical protein
MQTMQNETQTKTAPALPEKFTRRQHDNIDPAPATPALGDIYSMNEFVKRHENKFTRGQMLWFMRNRDHNGLAGSGAVILAARKFYINEPLFSAWFTNQKA